LAVITAAASGQPTPTFHNLTGEWHLMDVVESSALPQFKGLGLGFQVFLRQKGDHVSGIGEKLTENGRRLPREARSQITIEGSVSGDLLEATFTELGVRRISTGVFQLRIKDEGNRLDGRFGCTAGNSQGRSTATKVQWQDPQ